MIIPAERRYLASKIGAGKKMERGGAPRKLSRGWFKSFAIHQGETKNE